MSSDDEKPNVLITGANRGLGLEMSRVFLEKGWCVIAVCRSTSTELQSLQSAAALEVHTLDLVSDSELQALAETLQGRVIDVLLNNAGTMGRKNFAELGIEAGSFGSFDRAEWHEVFDINVCTPMRMAELLVDNVAASSNGRMVMLSSMVGSMALNGIGSMYAYRASKAAVNAITKSMAIDLEKRGIVAVALHPGFVRTEMSGPMAEIEPAESAAGMVKVIEQLSAEQAGQVIAWDGSILPW